ncbi:hypothetical protein OHW83_06775 [Acinetobacter baumannii]|uniref:hypothetical protein n=1 Tax=Acinetobacter calcoaceticus/baumannii complex TaxID=909768 RepID=UPI00083A2D53|nr:MULTISPECIES: hypothetical protein [Acinetobacter calcoaceticus/baumannii complex]MDC5297563.1 hypothetical protein [Acinetobacter baumannii]MDE4038617.1 hypothetical protein [Acinetobacter pittii]OCZ55504.1 hypothetical protein A7P21_02260 [Acinetobacter seifertii]
MNLLNIISNIKNFSDEYTIYAESPWTTLSDAIVVEEPEDGAMKISDSDKVYEYFLEIFIVKDLLSDLSQISSFNKLTVEDQVNRIIEYAINDA